MRFTARESALMALLIALNVTVGGIVHVIKLPIFLDSMGTIIAALILGPLGAVAVGVLSFLVSSALINPVYVWFIGTQDVIALFVYFVASRFAAFRSTERVVITGVLLGVVAGIVSAPIIVLVFGGVAGSGRDLITAVLVNSGQQIYKAVVISGAASEPIDKLIQTLAAYFIIKSLPKRLLRQFANTVLERNGFL